MIQLTLLPASQPLSAPTLALMPTWGFRSLSAGHCLNFLNLCLPWKWYPHPGPGKPKHSLILPSQAHTHCSPFHFPKHHSHRPDFYWRFWNNRRRQHKSAHFSKQLKIILVSVHLRYYRSFRELRTPRKPTCTIPSGPSPLLCTDHSWVYHCSSKFQSPHKTHLFQGQQKIKNSCDSLL